MSDDIDYGNPHDTYSLGYDRGRKAERKDIIRWLLKVKGARAIATRIQKREHYDE